MERRQIPDWMTRENTYEIPKDRDSFLTKSCLSLLSVLEKARFDGARGNLGPSAPVKLFGSLYLIVLAALARNMFFTYLMLAILIVGLCILPGKTTARIVRNALVAMAISLILLLPSVFMGSPKTMLTVSLKVFFSVGILSTMAATTPWNQVTRSLKFAFVPDVFIFTFDITLKYIVLLGQICSEVLISLRLRSVGKNRAKAQSFSGVLGVAFLKTKTMADEMYQAMACRGFEGEYPRGRKIRLEKKDWIYVAAALGILCLFFYLK